jgi:hypothetical protein
MSCRLCGEQANTEAHNLQGPGPHRYEEKCKVAATPNESLCCRRLGHFGPHNWNQWSMARRVTKVEKVGEAS